MSDIDFEGKTISEIDDIISKAQAVKDAKRQAALKEAYKKLQTMAQDLGVSIEQILEVGGAALGRFAKPQTPKVPDKYRDPQNHSLTWSGRGKPPRWMQEALTKGKTKDDFLIK